MESCLVNVVVDFEVFFADHTITGVVNIVSCFTWSGPDLSALSDPLVAHPLDTQSSGTCSVQ